MGSLNIGADAPLRKRAGESGAARAVERDMAAVLGHPPEHDPEKACSARDAGECRFSEKIMLEKRCGCSSMVEQQPSKLNTRVRFPSPAPEISKTKQPHISPQFHFRDPARASVILRLPLVFVEYDGSNLPKLACLQSFSHERVAL